MRLRIKSPAGRLERLELPGEAPTLAGAQAAVAQAFGLPPADDIVLSFNNKVHRASVGQAAMAVAAVAAVPRHSASNLLLCHLIHCRTRSWAQQRPLCVIWECAAATCCGSSPPRRRHRHSSQLPASPKQQRLEGSGAAMPTTRLLATCQGSSSSPRPSSSTRSRLPTRANRQ